MTSLMLTPDHASIINSEQDSVPVPPGIPVRLLDLRPGDRAHLPVTDGEDGRIEWSEAVTITGVLLIDTDLVQVRWEPVGSQDPFTAHRLLMGSSYRAGAIRAGTAQ
jgi:hypothetical protein